MKKLIFSLSALAALFLAGSCQRENLEPVQQGGTVTYTVQVPGALATKTDGARFVAYYEVYRQGEVEDGTKSPVYEGSQPFENGSANIELEFVKDQNFIVLFWAQKEGVTVYDIADLRKVAFLSPRSANNANYEVFAGNDEVSNCVSSNKGNVVLSRPIAQINIATLTSGLTLGTATSSSVVVPTESYAMVSGLYAGYNVATGAPVGVTGHFFTFTSEDVPDPTFNNDYTLVGMNYVGFMPKEGANVEVDFKIFTANDGEITHSVSNVPVKPNYKTNIIGNLISATADYNVTLGAWGTEETNVEVVAVSTAQDLQEAIENIQPGGAEGNIILEGDIDLGSLFAASTQAVTKAGGATLPIVIPENKAMTLDLNGFTITTPWEDETAGKHYYAFENHGTLNIVDSKVNGKIIARGIFNYGKMTLESGTIEACDGNGGYGVRNYEGAEFVMNGGTVATINEDGDIPGEGYDASPIRVDQGAKAEINGGIINNVSNFTVAIDNHGKTIVGDGTFTSVHTTLANSADMTINGGSFTCNGLEGITAHALWAAAGTTTINGGTFDGKDNYNGFNVDASAGAVVNITGGKFLRVHSGSLYGDGTISVTGGEFFDDPAERVAEGFIAEKNGEVWVVAKAPVAQIGEVKYYTLEEAVAAAKAGDTITVLYNVTLSETLTLPAGVTFNGNGKEIQGTINVAGDLAIMGDVTISTLKATNGGEISIEDGKVLTLRNFSFGSKDNANAEYEITGGTVTANYGFFQHGTYTLRSNFETGYMYYSYGSDITVYGTFHSQGKGDGLDYVRGNLTIAKGGKSIHDKTLWVGQPASWGAMEASLTIEDGGYVQANSLCVYAGSSLTYSNNADLKYNKKTFEGTIIAPQQNNEIWYTSDEMKLEPTTPTAINATVVSNVWDKTTGKGVITFDAPLTTIGEKAFQRVTNATPSNWATSISLPEGVETIGNYAFAQCYSLTTITIPNTVTAIGEYAFQSCDAVTSVTIGSGVTNIGSSAFYNCYEIKEIVCKSTTPPALADKWVFNGVDKAAKIIVPAASVDTYKAANFWSSFTNIVAE